jgi:hypothetical protein
MDRMQAPPRGAISGLLADAMFGGLNYMKDPRRTQQMQGLAAMLESTGVPAVVDRMSYGEPMTTGRGMTTKLRPEAENTLMAALGMIPAGRPAIKAIKATKGLPVGMSIKDVSAPQEAALRLAQQRAALPVEKGGLGLPKDNTAMDRAKAMGGKDQYHFSRTGGDYETLDSGQYAVAPFDAVGTHVGTKQAAADRFKNTTATTDQIKGTSYPVTILGDRPLLNQNDMPFGEDDLNAFLRKEGGHTLSDMKGGKMTYQDMNASLRKKLFEEQGYTSIPYFNEVEGKGSISYIVPPDNIRSRFAAFDPFRRNAAIASAMGVAAPNLLAAEQEPAPEQNESMIQSLLKMLGR